MYSIPDQITHRLSILLWLCMSRVPARAPELNLEYRHHTFVWEKSCLRSSAVPSFWRMTQRTGLDLNPTARIKKNHKPHIYP